MRKQERCIYEFGPFRIDNAERMLRRGTDVIPISPLVTDTLLVLLESGGRALTRTSCWIAFGRTPPSSRAD